ncbi:hypothetical protein RchiOBHm_Chr4g0422351 [Rosa chinensis]|uniref:Uncharacterized protein n=1 Tax=Rosa chinensis TaxID=74649 RepID=A0A2P6QYE1_ROSCH|nr:uncharacterized protein LOC112198343 isoform X2 [Rosa chinensis]PRQ39191.1 hypothetical protein RchiOBHm_Chr4g0422351 [Rosa chinensis]
MAGARLCATFPNLAHPILPATTSPKIPVSASVSVPSKITRRKNYLRPKILKTLNPKPDPQTAQPVVPVESPVTPSQDNHELEHSSDRGDVVLGGGGGAEVEELRVSETTAELSGISGKFSARTVLKYGGYFIGLFVLQTVVSVLLLGDSDPDENSKSRSSVLGKSNMKTSSGSELGNVVRFDESRLGEKIEEIRAMARKARKIEKNESKGSIGNEDDAFSKSKIKIGIEKEVGNRLVNLQKKLGSKREKLPGSFVNYLEMFGKFEDGVRKNNENVKEGDGALMFKKKLKFKTPTAEVNRNPKGFGGVKEEGGSSKNKTGSGGVDEIGRNASVGTDGMELLEADAKEKPRETLEKGTGRLDEGQDREAGNMVPQNGTVHRTIQGRSSAEDVESIKPRGFGKKNPESLKKEIQGRTVESDGPTVQSVSSGSTQKKAKKQALANKVSSKQSDNETDPWWLHLPYVLVIFMRRGSDGQGGLFSIELNSQSQNESDASYSVAFEDRGDANNFCFLLESCFEDQDDFRATAAPLPNKELHKAVKSDDMKVIVVKKGQLQLYAGQPFAEVEMALRSLVLQN